MSFTILIQLKSFVGKSYIFILQRQNYININNFCIPGSFNTKFSHKISHYILYSKIGSKHSF